MPNVSRDNGTPSLPDLHRRCHQALTANGITARLEISVENNGGIVILRGAVKTYYAKQMAQEVIRPVLKMYEPYPVLRNLIDVVQ